jgi:hypothetical protein
VRIFPVRSWTLYLILLPTFVAVILLAIFFFAALLALFTLAVVGFVLRFWWLRRKLGKAADAQTLKGKYVVIEETQITKTNADTADD